MEPSRLRALAHAQKYIGVMERPPGSNSGPKIDKWLTDAGVPTSLPAAEKSWCAAFVYGMFLEAGRKLPISDPAGVYFWSKWADDTGARVARPFLGDLVAYSWGGPRHDPGDHIGFVEKVLALPWPRNGWRFYIRTVEGNTGDGVYRRWRWVDPSTVAFIRVPGS